jgi:glycolate oxidase FAD binding subunit
MTDRDLSRALSERVRAAADADTPLSPCGGSTKAFLGRTTQAEALDCSGHAGIISYEPTELVITARAGTRMVELEAALADSGQMLPFEPPHFGEQATLGGTIAAGLSGPRRPYAGAARDLVLGTRIINGTGEVMRFGGAVMKNVAGYDVSRLMTGSMGTLGVLLDVSMKVLPRPLAEATLVFEHTGAEALSVLNEWAGTPLPLSAACHLGGRTWVRLSGSDGGVASAIARMGGERLEDGGAFWLALREQRLAFFEGSLPLWRISLPSTAPELALPGDTLTDWGGALRWLRSDVDGGAVRSVAAASGGHAMLFRAAEPGDDVYHPLSPVLARLHQRIKHAFDPRGILSPGRMYPEL